MRQTRHAAYLKISEKEWGRGNFLGGQENIKMNLRWTGCEEMTWLGFLEHSNQSKQFLHQLSTLPSSSLAQGPLVSKHHPVLLWCSLSPLQLTYYVNLHLQKSSRETRTVISYKIKLLCKWYTVKLWQRSLKCNKIMDPDQICIHVGWYTAVHHSTPSSFLQ